MTEDRNPQASTQNDNVQSSNTGDDAGVQSASTGDDASVATSGEENAKSQQPVKVFNWELALQEWKNPIQLADHPKTEFDDKKFTFLLAYSFSLAPEEKANIIKRIPELSQNQINQLLQIFIDEQEKFIELEKQYPEHVAKERDRHLKGFEGIIAQNKQEQVKSEDDEKADELRKKLGL